MDKMSGTRKRRYKNIPAFSKTDPVLQIGLNLRKLRQMSGLALQDVSEVLGVSYQQILKYESGRNRITAEKIHILRSFYNVSYSAFFEHLPAPDLSPLSSHKSSRIHPSKKS